MNGPDPYLSVVVTARNDDHGGNLLRRMQIFVNGWIAQTNRHDASSELIIVEWNPVEGRPPLAEALKWPSDLGLCKVRFITVSREVHSRFAHADALPLYQMIAKNAGIRRARGRFVLATNIDLLFNDELMRFLGERRLQSGRMYRIDRHDVMSNVPLESCIDEQLNYCRTHLIRVNTREGTFRLTPEGHRAQENDDVAAADSGIYFGRGWFGLERNTAGEAFRWAENEAEVVVSPCPDSRQLELEIEPGPGVGGMTFGIQVIDDTGSVAGRNVIHTASQLIVEVPPEACRVRLRTVGGGRPAANDPRILNFRVFRCQWLAGQEARIGAYQFIVHPRRPKGILGLVSHRSIGEFVRYYFETRSFPRAVHAVIRRRLRSRQMAVKLSEYEDVFQRGSGFQPGAGWHPLEHCFGETFRWVERDAHILVRPPRENPEKLVLQVEPGPGVDYKPFKLFIQDERGTPVASCVVRGLQLVEIPLPRRPDPARLFWLRLKGGDRPTRRDPRILNYRIFWCGGSTDRTWVTDGAPAVEPEVTSPVFLHTNGCGDFTLMDREHWIDLRGYPEFDLFSMNLDSVLCYTAHHAGFREEVLPEPMRAYHIEHATGSGWTPEGQAVMYARLAAYGIGHLDYQQLVGLAAQMRKLNCPMIFNLDNWGLGGEELPEQLVTSGSRVSATG